MENTKGSETRWPAVIGVMGIFYLLFIVLQFLCVAIYYRTEDVPFNMLGQWVFPVFLVSLVPLLFFVHTKRLAFLTAIPMFALAVIDAIRTLSEIGMWGTSEFMVTSLVPTVFSVVLLILYVIQMFARPHSPALSILFLICFILYLLFLGGALLVSYVSAPAVSFNLASFLSSLFGFIGLLFSAIAYTIAMFRSRKQV